MNVLAALAVVFGAYALWLWYEWRKAPLVEDFEPVVLVIVTEHDVEIPVGKGWSADAVLGLLDEVAAL